VRTACGAMQLACDRLQPKHAWHGVVHAAPHAHSAPLRRARLRPQHTPHPRCCAGSHDRVQQAVLGHQEQGHGPCTVRAPWKVRIVQPFGCGPAWHELFVSGHGLVALEPPVQRSHAFAKVKRIPVTHMTPLAAASITSSTPTPTSALREGSTSVAGEWWRRARLDGLPTACHQPRLMP
jgi:hypothetical protein